jgi:hypothetical protein
MLHIELKTFKRKKPVKIIPIFYREAVLQVKQHPTMENTLLINHIIERVPQQNIILTYLEAQKLARYLLTITENV